MSYLSECTDAELRRLAMKLIFESNDENKEKFARKLQEVDEERVKRAVKAYYDA